jgi:hypothetical protein
MSNEKSKVKLSFVNNGKPFIMPKWTIGKHRVSIAQLVKENPDVGEEEKSVLFNVYVIYQTLKQIDPDVKLDDIKEMHPENLNDLFIAVYNAGKEEIFFEEGTKPKTETKKHTGTKS